MIGVMGAGEGPWIQPRDLIQSLPLRPFPEPVVGRARRPGLEFRLGPMQVLGSDVRPHLPGVMIHSTPFYSQKHPVLFDNVLSPALPV